MPQLTDAERAEVALAVVKAQFRAKGIRLIEPSKFKRDVHNRARQVGVKPDMAMRFSHELVVDWLKEMFPNDPFLQQ